MVWGLENLTPHLHRDERDDPELKNVAEGSPDKLTLTLVVPKKYGAITK